MPDMESEEHKRDRRRAEAAQWVARLNSKPVARTTLDEFFAWRRGQGNAEAFVDAEKIWRDSEVLAFAPEIMAATEAVAQKTWGRRRPSSRLKILGVAAVVLITVTTSILWSRRDHSGAIETVIGERRHVALADGSEVELDADTRIAVQLRSDERSVRLDRGEAIFSVAHDDGRPFRVMAGGVVVTATGTRFDVRRSEAMTMVTLIEGSVLVRAPNSPATPLRPGEQWRSSVSALPVVSAVDTDRSTAWLRGRVIFDATPLEDALVQINRYARKPVRLADPRFARQPVSGSFDISDTDGFVKAITTLLPLGAVEKDRIVSLEVDERRSSGNSFADD